jgi:hypothetical protein
MKKLVTVLAAAGFIAALAGPLVADEKTIKGEVVDQVCFTKDNAQRGADHEACTMRCAKRGQPLAIVAEDGVYTVVGKYAADNNKMMLDYVAKNVTVTGDVMAKDGSKTIDIKKIEVAK